MNNLQEIWADVPGYEGLYKVSTFGKVLSVSRTLKRKGRNGKLADFRVPERILAQSESRPGGRPDSQPYKCVTLSRLGVSKTKLVHRLVMLAFTDEAKGKPQVNHKDGNKGNNRADNLEWVDNSENQLHAYRNGLKPDESWAERGEDNHRSLPVLRMSLAGRVIERYPSIGVASEGGFAKSAIIGCCKSKPGYNTHKGFRWAYGER